MPRRTAHTHPMSPERNAADGADRWWLVAAAGLAVFMASVDMSIVNLALPAIETELGVHTSIAEWVLLAYLLPLAGLALPGGRWLDTVAPRPALAFSLGGFTMASLAAGIAPSLAWLLAARLVQGAFGAFLFALVPALATTAVRAQARGRAMGLITTLGPLGLITGPALGGALVDGPGWRWIFFINLPVSLVILMVGLVQLPRGGHWQLPTRAWAGEALLLCGAVAALLLALSLVTTALPAGVALAGLAAGLIVLAVRRPAHAAVRHLLSTTGESGPHLALALAATAIGTVFFITPYFLQQVLGATAQTAGATLLAFPAGMALTGLVGGLLGDRWGTRRTAVVGAGLFTVGLALLVPLDAAWEPRDLLWRLLLAGCGSGLFNAPVMATAMTNAPASLLATTGATTSLARQLGFALGPALATLAWGLWAYQPDGMRTALLLATVLSAGSVLAVGVTRREARTARVLASDPRTGEGSSR